MEQIKTEDTPISSFFVDDEKLLRGFALRLEFADDEDGFYVQVLKGDPKTDDPLEYFIDHEQFHTVEQLELAIGPLISNIWAQWYAAATSKLAKDMADDLTSEPASVIPDEKDQGLDLYENWVDSTEVKEDERAF